MNFNKHSDLEGKHAFLSASKYHWINYDEQKISDAYLKFLATQKGTELHAFACQCIKLGIKLPNEDKTLNLYINDAIDFGMTPEQPLYYSKNCFGTPDAIAFKDRFLRIHDLKSGIIPASMRQLEIYNALFCLEYDKMPDEIKSELRIYQSDTIFVHRPESEAIATIMSKIVVFSEKLEKIQTVEE